MFFLYSTKVIKGFIMKYNNSVSNNKACSISVSTNQVSTNSADSNSITTVSNNSILNANEAVLNNSIPNSVALTYPSSVLSHDYLKSFEIASAIIKDEVGTLEDCSLNGNSAVYLFWSLNKGKGCFTNIKEYAIKYITCIFDTYTIDNVIYNNELVKMSFFVAFVPQNKESKLDEYLASNGLSNFIKSNSLSDSIYSCVTDHLSKGSVAIRSITHTENSTHVGNTTNTNTRKTTGINDGSLIDVRNTADNSFADNGTVSEASSVIEGDKKSNKRDSEFDICLDCKGIVAKSFKVILRNITSRVSIILDNNIACDRSKKFQLISQYIKNDTIHEKIQQKVDFLILEPGFELLYPYFVARTRYARDFFNTQKKKVALARRKAFTDLLEIEINGDIDEDNIKDTTFLDAKNNKKGQREAIQRDVNRITFLGTFKIGKTSNAKDSSNYSKGLDEQDLDKLPCQSIFKKSYLEDVKKRDIQLDKFRKFFLVNTGNQNLSAIEYNSKINYSIFFKNEEIKPYWLLEDPITKEFTNLEYFFLIVSMYAHKVNTEDFEFEYVVISNNKSRRLKATYSRSVNKESSDRLSMLLFQDIRYRLERWSLFHYDVFPYFEDTYKIIDYKIG